jgi:hypothetical protein
VRGFCGVLATIFYFVSGIAYIGIHLWTVLLFYNMKGFVWAFISFLAPVLSPMFMAGITIADYGFLNMFTLVFIGVSILYGLAILFAAIATKETIGAE